MRNISNETWLAWIGAIIVTVAVGTAFAFGNFETIDHAKQTRDAFQSQLIRMDDKLDRIIEAQKK
jgi:hypothetical protein